MSVANIFIVLGLITALGAAVKAGELLVVRGIRGFRGIRNFGRAIGVVFDIAEEFKNNNGESLRDQIDKIRSEQKVMESTLNGLPCHTLLKSLSTITAHEE